MYIVLLYLSIRNIIYINILYSYTNTVYTVSVHPYRILCIRLRLAVSLDYGIDIVCIDVALLYILTHTSI